MLNAKRGITLIALVITVIILLILAGTAISISINGSNIFEKTSEAREDWNAKVKTEEVTINDYLVYVDDLTIPAWDGTVGTSFAGGTGTKEDPYRVENGEQLAYLAKSVNDGNNYTGKFIVLIKSINLGMIKFTPIGLNRNFNGTIDGNGNVITGINICEEEIVRIGLIARLNEDGKIQNLKLGNGTIIGLNNVGGIVGENHGIISNCSNKASVKTLNFQVGGITGLNEANGSIINCYNSGNIEATTSNAGGISGSIRGGSISGCVNTGNITSNRQAGGISGATNGANIYGCYNTGKVSTTIGSTCGGIVAYFLSGNISNCTNVGIITAKINAAGGIAGVVDGETIVISNVYNEGDVSSQNNQIVGGIIGIFRSGKIENAYNKGEIEGGYIGGICGTQTGGELIKTYYYSSSSSLKGIGSSSEESIIAVEDVTGQTEKTSQIFNSITTFLSWLSK